MVETHVYEQIQKVQMSPMRSLASSLALTLAGLTCQAATPALGGGFSASYRSPPAPELRLKSLDGSRYDLATMKGRVVVVNFWAGWCPPCIEEFPSMQKLWQSTRASPLDVAAVNVGEDVGGVRKFLAEFAPKLKLIVVLDSSGEAFEAWVCAACRKPS